MSTQNCPFAVLFTALGSHISTCPLSVSWDYRWSESRYMAESVQFITTDRRGTHWQQNKHYVVYLLWGPSVYLKDWLLSICAFGILCCYLAQYWAQSKYRVIFYWYSMRTILSQTFFCFKKIHINIWILPWSNYKKKWLSLITTVVVHLWIDYF